MKDCLFHRFDSDCSTSLLPRSGSTVYDEYAHTPIAGWRRTTTSSFEVSPLLEPGHYKQSLGLRITGAYPFMGLTLIVVQMVYHRNRKIPGECKIDTVNCQLIDNNGVSKGQGISYYQITSRSTSSDASGRFHTRSHQT